MSSERVGARRQQALTYLAAAWALHGVACGGNTSAAPVPPDAAAGAGAQAGSAGAGGSSGGLVNPRCGTRDDGAEVLADDLEKPLSLLLDASHLYHLFLGGEPGAYVNTIYKRALEVGAPLEQLWTREGTVRGFALSERYAWWVHQPTVAEPPWDLSEITLFRVAKAGGPAEVMIPGYVESIVSSPQGLVTLRMGANLEGVNGTFQLLPSSGGVPKDLCEYHGLKYVAANATAVVWIGDHGIETCPLTGGATSLVHALDPSEVPVALAVDSTQAYWSTFVGIYRVPLAGGERETIAVHPDPASPSFRLVLDGEEIFFERGRSRILRAPKTDGSPRDAVPPQTDIGFFTVNAAHIYWAEGYPIACLKRMLK